MASDHFYAWTCAGGLGRGDCPARGRADLVRGGVGLAREVGSHKALLHLGCCCTDFDFASIPVRGAIDSSDLARRELRSEFRFPAPSSHSPSMLSPAAHSDMSPLVPAQPNFRTFARTARCFGDPCAGCPSGVATRTGRPGTLLSQRFPKATMTRIAVGVEAAAGHRGSWAPGGGRSRGAVQGRWGDRVQAGGDQLKDAQRRDGSV